MADNNKEHFGDILRAKKVLLIYLVFRGSKIKLALIFSTTRTRTTMNYGWK